MRLSKVSPPRCDLLIMLINNGMKNMCGDTCVEIVHETIRSTPNRFTTLPRLGYVHANLGLQA